MKNLGDEVICQLFFKKKEKTNHLWYQERAISQNSSAVPLGEGT